MNEERAEALAMIAHRAPGRVIVGVEIDRAGGLRIVLEGGAAIVMAPDGTIDFDGFPARAAS